MTLIFAFVMRGKNKDKAFYIVPFRLGIATCMYILGKNCSEVRKALGGTEEVESEDPYLGTLWAQSRADSFWTGYE